MLYEYYVSCVIWVCLKHVEYRGDSGDNTPQLINYIFHLYGAKYDRQQPPV